MLIKSKLIDSLKSKVNSKLKDRPNLKKIITNLSWLSFDRLLQLFVSFVVIIWMIRYLGPEKWGTLNYVWAFVGIFSVFISLGLNQVLFKELVENEQRKNALMGTTFWLQLVSSIILTFVTIICAIFFLNDSTLIFFIFISSLPNLWFSFGIISTFFDSYIKGKYGVLARNIALIISSLLKVYFILFNFSLFYFVLVSVIESVLINSSLIYFYARAKNDFLKWKFDIVLAKKLLSQSWPLILSSVSMMVYLRIDQLFIGAMLSVYDLGIYSVVVKLAEFGNFIPGIIVFSVLPIIIKNKTNPEVYKLRLIRLYSVITAFGIAIFVFLFLFADFIIYFLYGAEFIAAVPILRIYSFAVIPFFISVVLFQQFIIENKTKYSLYVTIIGAISNVILNLLLIPLFGTLGAAFATVISYSLIIFSLLLFKNSREYFFIILKSFNLFKYLKIN